jgi:hypothetical protein
MTSRAERVEVWSHAANLVTRSFTPEYRTLARQMQVTGTGFGHPGGDHWPRRPH